MTYWEKRANERMIDYVADAERTANYIGSAYQKAYKYFRSQIIDIFKGFKGLGMSDRFAAQILKNVNLDDGFYKFLMKAVGKVTDEEERRRLMLELNSPAYQWRMGRLDEMNKKIVERCNELYKTELQKGRLFLSDSIKNAYKRTVFDIQQGTGTWGAFDIMPTSRINEILKRNWSGEMFSERIWGNVTDFEDRIKQSLLTAFMTGQSEREVAESLSYAAQVGYNDARRLMRTECTYVTNQAEQESYKTSGIDEYEFLAILDNRTSDDCEEHDGKKYKLSDAAVGINLPPLHPYCRSTTVPVLPSAEEIQRNFQKIGDKIGADVDFDEWVKHLEEKDGKYVYKAD